MARPGTTHAKRNRELARNEKNAEKAARRAARREQETPDVPDGVDPDIAGIVPGPQPPRDDD